MINISIKQLFRRDDNIYMYLQIVECITDLQTYITLCVCLGKWINFKYSSEHMEKDEVSTVTLREHTVHLDVSVKM